MTALGAIGCTHDPDPPQCPAIAAGDLVVTEVRGGSHEDPLGAWVELYNASGADIDLRGLGLSFHRLDGGGELPDVTVRRSLALPAEGYAVLGLFPDDARPAHVDYGFQDDFVGATFPGTASLDTRSCTDLIDRVQWDSLPAMGTYSFGGMPPSASTNDFPTMWCTDANPGTPRAANHACP